MRGNEQIFLPSYNINNVSSWQGDHEAKCWFVKVTFPRLQGFKEERGLFHVSPCPAGSSMLSSDSLPLFSITVVYVCHVIFSTACDGQQGTGAPWTSSVLSICNLKVVW